MVSTASSVRLQIKWRGRVYELPEPNETMAEITAMAEAHLVEREVLAKHARGSSVAIVFTANWLMSQEGIAWLLHRLVKDTHPELDLTAMRSVLRELGIAESRRLRDAAHISSVEGGEPAASN